MLLSKESASIYLSARTCQNGVMKLSTASDHKEVARSHTQS
jgi:hypothetical protein